jgi:uncharacterized protein YxjI
VGDVKVSTLTFKLYPLSLGNQYDILDDDQTVRYRIHGNGRVIRTAYAIRDAEDNEIARLEAPGDLVNHFVIKMQGKVIATIEGTTRKADSDFIIDGGQIKITRHVDSQLNGYDVTVGDTQVAAIATPFKSGGGTRVQILDEDYEGLVVAITLAIFWSHKQSSSRTD